MPFDPDAPAASGSGIFGLPHSRKDSRVILIPVPFDATTSYAPGTMEGPTAIFNASGQVDLFDRQFGRVYEKGIYMLEEVHRIRALSDEMRDIADALHEGDGDSPEDEADRRRINAACEEVNQYVYAETAKVLREGKIPGVVGGEHSVPFGAIRACAEKHPGLGILHLDAHLDLRDAYEGLAWSHASIMHNVLSRIPQVATVVHAGIRDFGEREVEFSRSMGARSTIHYDADWARRLADGEKFSSLCGEAINPLPANVYVSFDIDALDPSLCPHTGTPVPGGFSFNHAAMMLETLRKSGRTIVGFDLVEVAPPSAIDDGEWDANVGARVLYKLCGIV